MSSTTAPGVTDSVDFFGTACVMPRPWTLGWFGRIFFYSSIGTLLILANFPKFLTTLVMVNVSNPDWQAALLAPLQVVESTLGLVIGGQPLQFFERTMTAALLFSWLFFGTLTLFCVRRRSFRMLLYSGMGLIAGFFVLHMAAWIAATVVVTVSGVIYVGRWVAGGIEAIVGFLVSNGWVFGGLGLLVAIALLRSQFALMPRLFARYFVQIFGGVALVVVLAFAVPAFYNWVIAPVLRFFWRLLTPLLAWGGSLAVPLDRGCGRHSRRRGRWTVYPGYCIGGAGQFARIATSSRLARGAKQSACLDRRLCNWRMLGIRCAREHRNARRSPRAERGLGQRVRPRRVRKGVCVNIYD